MTRAYLLHRLNLRAATRYGLTEISDGVLDDWLEAKIITAPDKHGRNRLWTARHYRRALEIVRLKSLGISDLGIARLILWLKNLDVPYLTGRFNDRDILVRNYQRLANKLLKPIHSTYPQVKDADVSGQAAKSVLRNMGELDATLAPVIEYQGRELLDAYEVFKYGTGNGRFLLVASNRILSRLLPHPLLWFLGLILPKNWLSKALDQLLWLMRGIWAQGDEGSAIESIRNATPEQLETARRLLRISIKLFGRMGFRKVAYSLLHPTWRIGMFVMLLHAIYRSSKTNRLKWLFEPQDMKLIEAKFFN